MPPMRDRFSKGPDPASCDPDPFSRLSEEEEAENEANCCCKEETDAFLRSLMIFRWTEAVDPMLAMDEEVRSECKPFDDIAHDEVEVVVVAIAKQPDVDTQKRKYGERERRKGGTACSAVRSRLRKGQRRGRRRATATTTTRKGQKRMSVLNRV